MKKGFKFILTLLIIVGILFGVKYVYDNYKEEKRIEEVKKGWYVEITVDELKVRDDHDRFSYNKSKMVVKKGEIYKALEYYVGKGDNYYNWYKIEFKDGTNGWIANTKDGKNLIDYNNEEDVATPVIKYFSEKYFVKSIEDINYDKLEVWDDRPGYVVTHVVEHEVDEEEGIDQYWIKYTITDASGKSASKRQPIIFTIRPKESQVIEFIP